MNTRHGFQHIILIGALLLVMLMHRAGGVLSEAATKQDTASAIAASEHAFKAMPQVAPATLPVASAVNPLPEGDDSAAQGMPARRVHEWPCLLPEGCELLVSPSPSTSEAPKSALAPHETPAPIQKAEVSATDAAWVRRYQLYQALITAGSAPLLQLGASDDATEEPSLTLRLLHGRADAQNYATFIEAEGRNYPAIPPILVAAAIAEQASDIERVFGIDVLEQTALAFPGLENMSVGIAQIRPREAQMLGLGEGINLFNPEIAIRGMYAKMAHANARIEHLQDPEAPLALTDRYMLLSLAQNSLSKVDEFFALDGDWDVILQQDNNARVMRYFIVHLDWLLLNGWALPAGVDLDYWRACVFSTPEIPSEVSHDED